jgi:hypothetical protein
MSTDAINAAATDHLPFFITGPGQTDVLFNVMMLVILVSLIGLGAFYFKLHALPEHLMHGSQKAQLEIVGVLALISLFTHNHIFWIAGLLLAFIDLPDFWTPLDSMARSLKRIAHHAGPPVEEAPPEPAAEAGAAAGAVVTDRPAPKPDGVAPLARKA